MILFYILLFIGSIALLYWSGSRLVKSLITLCRFLKMREFVIGFFVMAIATSLPNLFVDINAALQGIPQLAFGDIVGGNIVDLTLVIGLAVLLSNISLPADSRMVQTSAFFTMAIGILPLILVMDGKIGRFDGIILILAFFLYAIWMFGNPSHFAKGYRGNPGKNKGIIGFLKDSISVVFFSALLLIASSGMVVSAKYFSSYLGIGLSLVGILIVGLGNCAPEAYFSAISARKEQNWLILGNLMGSVIVCTTLILGLVAIISPFEITDYSPFLIARIFTIISAIAFFIMARTGKTIIKIEGAILILIYFVFLASEIYFK